MESTAQLSHMFDLSVYHLTLLLSFELLGDTYPQPEVPICFTENKLVNEGQVTYILAQQ